MYALGIDFGTNSVRALIADLETGEEVGTYVHNYKRGVDGIILDERDPNFARQDPHDYVEGLEASVRGAIRDAEGVRGFSADKIIGIGIDTTGSTPIPVDSDGVPLAFNKKFSDNPNAYAWLWKDHTSYEEAALITAKAHESSIDYTKYSGSVYSSEWFFSKILHLANTDPEVYEAAASFVEHCDWMPAMLVGNTDPKQIFRSRCAAGHKAMWNAEWGGLPPQEFWSSVSTKLDGIISKLYRETYTADVKVGGLCAKWAEKLGLREGIAVAVGAFDAHMGAVGAGIMPGTLVKIMGTSTCDMMVVPPAELNTQIKGICGQVDGSIVPGMIGLEAGQSAVGDIFAWYRDQMRWGVENLLPSNLQNLAELIDGAKKTALEVLTQKASKLQPGQSGLLALDWFNGNRTVLVDPNLTGMIVGLTLGTKPEEVFMALIEATAFGGKVIMERFQEYGINVNDVIACGGLAERNPFLMQIYADVTGRPMKVSHSSQTCALGSAMFGAVAAGYFSKVEEAQKKMSHLKDFIYMPNSNYRQTYDRLFSLYRILHDSFGTREYSENLFNVMKELLEIKRSVC
ncbi:MAG: ribulokinase [Armatimonadota bacterium]|nr:ribulokinase [Armatimonadota bacterium]